jgi:UPF0755 protein
MKRKYSNQRPLGKRRWRRLVLFVVSAAIFLGVVALIAVRQVYTGNLVAIEPGGNKEIVVSIPTGTSVADISKLLKEKGLIRADWAFSQYVRSQELVDSLKAGTYRLSTGQSVSSIAADLVASKVAVDLFTILPGQRLDQIRQAFIKVGYEPALVDKAFDPSNYANLTALVDKPAAATLEGYLYPDSFQKTADTLPSTIIRASLNEMGSMLTAELRSAYASKGLTTYKAITLASIVEREVNSQEDRATAAQVFFKRISSGIMLGSDVTACYGAISSKVMKTGDNCNNFVSYDTPYNTRLHTGLPPGPISNVTKSGLVAVANPSPTDFLYFVAGDDGVTHFSKTNAEHEAAAAKYCKKLCQ